MELLSKPRSCSTIYQPYGLKVCNRQEDNGQKYYYQVLFSFLLFYETLTLIAIYPAITIVRKQSQNCFCRYSIITKPIYEES